MIIKFDLILFGRGRVTCALLFSLITITLFILEMNAVLKACSRRRGIFACVGRIML